MYYRKWLFCPRNLITSSLAAPKTIKPKLKRLLSFSLDVARMSSITSPRPQYFPASLPLHRLLPSLAHYTSLCRMSYGFLTAHRDRPRSATGTTDRHHRTCFFSLPHLSSCYTLLGAPHPALSMSHDFLLISPSSDSSLRTSTFIMGNIQCQQRHDSNSRPTPQPRQPDHVSTTSALALGFLWLRSRRLASGISLVWAGVA